MKTNTPELMKFKRLQRRLGVSVAQLVGHLELLWIATAKNAPEGDIGRFSNEDIAIACYWDGEPDFFIDSLIECGWLDASDDWRLLVHDWAQHAPTYVHGGLKRHGRSFRTNSAETPKEPPKERPVGISPEDTPTKPSLTKPNQAKPSEREGQAPKENSRSLSKHFEDARFKKAWSDWRLHLTHENKPLNAVSELAVLMRLEDFTTDEAISIITFSIERGAKNLILNGDHKGKPPPETKLNGMDKLAAMIAAGGNK